MEIRGRIETKAKKTESKNVGCFPGFEMKKNKNGFPRIFNVMLLF